MIRDQKGWEKVRRPTPAPLGLSQVLTHHGAGPRGAPPRDTTSIGNKGQHLSSGVDTLTRTLACPGNSIRA